MPDIQSIAAQFENQTLPKEQWTHHAHIAVAFAHLEKYKNEELALPNLRQGIKAYNTAVGTANTDTSGYHETLTTFWTKVICEFLAQMGKADIEKLYSIFLQTSLSSSQFPGKFYSRELLFSRTARKEWVDPNLLPVSAIKNIIHKIISIHK